MIRRSAAIPYILLFLWAAISMGYYVTGTAALVEHWFYGTTRGTLPFYLHNDGTIFTLKRQARAAGITEGDTLVSLNGERFSGDYQVTTYEAHTSPGELAAISVRDREGRLKSATVPLVRVEGPGFSVGGLIAYLTPLLGVSLLSLLVGYWVVTARPNDPLAWLVLLLLTFPEVSFGDIAPTWWGGGCYILFAVWGACVEVLALPALLWFGLYFPERSPLDIRFPRAKWLLFGTQAIGSALVLRGEYVYSFEASSWAEYRGLSDLGDRVVSYTEVACIAIFLVAIFEKLRSASTPDAKRRLRALAVGSALSLGPIVLMFTLLPLFGFDPHHGSLFEVVIPFVALFPLTLAYVVVVQRAMDLRVLLRIGTKYLVAKATLVVVEFALAGFVIIRFILPMLERKQHQALDLLVLAGVIALLARVFTARNGLSRRLQRWLDTRFFREAYDAELVLSELSEHARKLTEKGPLVDTVSRRISEVLHVHQVVVWLRQSNAFYLQQAIGFQELLPVLLAESSATVQNLTLTNRPATVYKDRPEEWFSEAGAEERLLLNEVRAEVLLPLPGRDRLMGVMALGPKRSEEPYTPTDLRVLQSVATQTGLALEVDELAHSLAKEAAQRARIDREIEIAHEVQERLFPQSMPSLAGISLAGFCRPAQGVGGDYYDAIDLPDGRLGLAIGDVSGKGISAALLMASLRACLRTMTLVGSMDLATLMQKMNQLVYEASGVNRYATFFFAIYDPGAQTLSYVNAGHNPPILLRKCGDGSVVHTRLEAGGMVVGLLPHALYEEQSLIVEPGDLLLGYTDGISEAMTADDEEWGEERMILAAETSMDDSADTILHDVFRAADQFTNNAPQHDDMTLLVAKLS